MIDVAKAERSPQVPTRQLGEGRSDRIELCPRGRGATDEHEQTRRGCDPGGDPVHADLHGRAQGTTARASSAAPKPSAAVTGIVSTQAPAMVRTMPQRTAFMRRAAPAPRMLELITWVVLKGRPNRDETSMTVAAAVSAANPWIGWSWASRVPM